MTTRTSPSILLVVAVAAGLAVNLLLGVFYASLPSLPAPAGVTFLVLGLVEGGVAVVLYRRIRRRPRARPVDALAAARAVALAKASALAGALVGGAWCGVLAYVLPRRAQVAAAASDTTAALIGIVGAAVLVAAALTLEWCCRTPDDQDTRPTPDR
jgi:ABC-type Co2+ transport system permease subunit